MYGVSKRMRRGLSIGGSSSVQSRNGTEKTPRHPSTVIFSKVMNNKDIQVLFKLSKFCKDILATFKVIHSNI